MIAAQFESLPTSVTSFAAVRPDQSTDLGSCCAATALGHQGEFRRVR
jgi:hypothetical protein